MTTLRLSHSELSPTPSSDDRSPAVSHTATLPDLWIRDSGNNNAATPQGQSFATLKGPPIGRYLPGEGILRAGARVGILCDTLHGDPEIGLGYREAIDTAAALIRKLGFVPVIDEAHARVAPYFERWAGTALDRVSHFKRLVDSLQVDAVFPLFGKGGCHAVIDLLATADYRPPRPVVLIGGFSHHADWSLFALSPAGKGYFSHVINATQAAYWKLLPEANVQNLESTLQRAASVEYEGLQCLNPERWAAGRVVAGRLIGGNMGVVLLNANKRWMPDLVGAIVLCEDYDRHAHDFHRSFYAFARSVEQAGAHAIVVGAMLPMKKPGHGRLDPEQRKAAILADRKEVDAIISEVASRTSIPIFYQPAICGHGAMNHPLGLGGHTEIHPRSDGTATLHNGLRITPTSTRAWS